MLGEMFTRSYDKVNMITLILKTTAQIVVAGATLFLISRFAVKKSQRLPEQNVLYLLLGLAIGFAVVNVAMMLL